MVGQPICSPAGVGDLDWLFLEFEEEPSCAEEGPGAAGIVAHGFRWQTLASGALPSTIWGRMPPLSLFLSPPPVPGTPGPAVSGTGAQPSFVVQSCTQRRGCAALGALALCCMLLFLRSESSLRSAWEAVGPKRVIPASSKGFALCRFCNLKFLSQEGWANQNIGN